MLAQSTQPLLRIVMALQQLVHLGNPPLHRLLEQREENIFLAGKVRIKSPARVPSPRRNISQARCLIPIARKRLLRRQQKFPPGSRSPRRLPRWCRHDGYRSFLTAGRCNSGRSSHCLVALTVFIALQDTYMHVYNKSSARARKQARGGVGGPPPPNPQPILPTSPPGPPATIRGSLP